MHPENAAPILIYSSITEEKSKDTIIKRDEDECICGHVNLSDSWRTEAGKKDPALELVGKNVLANELVQHFRNLTSKGCWESAC